MPNLTRGNIRALLPQYDIPDDQADVSIQIVFGWLCGAIQTDALPDPLPQELWADALELAVLLVSNPESFSQKTVGATSRAWPIIARRDSILNRVAQRYAQQRLAARGSYPDAPDWPEPADPYGDQSVPMGSGWWWIDPS